MRTPQDEEGRFQMQKTTQLSYPLMIMSQEERKLRKYRGNLRNREINQISSPSKTVLEWIQYLHMHRPVL